MLVIKPVLSFLSVRTNHPPPFHLKKKKKMNEKCENEMESLEMNLLELENKVIRDDPADGTSPEEERNGHHTFGEIMIHQFIEVIEFVLGSISNTASYLRLWALSLAHSQLASVGYHSLKVFLEMTILGNIRSGNIVGIFLGFPVFFGATVGVLMTMDLLECFLHTLRLHW